MRIIKIIDNFVSNSSSAGTTILLAVKKGKNFSSLMRSLGIPESEIKDYVEDLDERWLHSVKGIRKPYEFKIH